MSDADRPAPLSRAKPEADATEPTELRADKAGGETTPAPRQAASGTGGAAKRRWWMFTAGGVVILLLLFKGVPWLVTALTTVSTDDAFVNGHVTFVAPRVAGQVTRVLVDDNNRVQKGDLLVQIDKEPFELEVNSAQAAVTTAQADLVAARAHVRGLAGMARSQRFKLEHAMEALDQQVAELRSRVAALQSQKATVARARADYERERPLVKEGVVSRQEFDAYTEANLVAQAQLEKTRQEVYEIRARLGLPVKFDNDDELADVPADVYQTFSDVKDAQSQLIQTVAQLGVVQSFNETPQEMLAEFYRRDPEGNIDRILTELMKQAPAVQQAEAKVGEADARLDQAKLDLRYCDVLAEIDGVVTRRTVNPGDHVVAGENMMAVRSLTEIWIDANFKETQLAKLRIGQPVDVDVDMYGGRQRFRGRISGFTMGTGSTLALLPAENATGNFVKVVQRLPVRIELVDYDPDTTPLFIGLSVTPYVHVNEPPTGPDAGKVLQPHPAAPVAGAPES